MSFGADQILYGAVRAHTRLKSNDKCHTPEKLTQHVRAFIARTGAVDPVFLNSHH
jgi:hypothetical protein